MNHKNELPPGWGENNSQENPWGNAAPQSNSDLPQHWEKHAAGKPPVRTFREDKPAVPDLSADEIFGKLKQGTSKLRLSAENAARNVQEQAKSFKQERANTPDRMKPQVSDQKSIFFREQPAEKEYTPDFKKDISEPESDSISPLIIIIPLTVAVLAFLGGLLFMRARQQKDHSAETAMQMQDMPVQEQITEVPDTATEMPVQAEHLIAKIEIPAATETENAVITTEPVPTGHAEQETKTEPQKAVVQEPAPLPEEPSAPEFDLKAEYRSIVNRDGAPINTGYYTDVNDDGKNELILKNPAEMNFHMYTYGGEMHETYFGYYSSMSEAKLFRVPAANGQYYFYWRCEYKLYSLQGYYDPFTNSQIDIGVNYDFDDHAEWVLFFNNDEYASGREEGASTYGATPNCYQKLLTMFQDYSFQIYDDSDYKKLDCMDKTALLRAIG